MVVTRWGARFMGRRIPCAIGRGGIRADKAEGDGATPAGVWHLEGVFWRADRGASVATSLTVTPIGPRDIWSDDPADPDYNHALRAAGHPYSHERLRRADPLYDLVLVSDWNWPDAVPGRGSAIFLHQQRRPGYPTEGCLALARKHLHAIAPRITPGTRLIVR